MQRSKIKSIVLSKPEERKKLNEKATAVGVEVNNGRPPDNVWFNGYVKKIQVYMWFSNFDIALTMGPEL